MNTTKIQNIEFKRIDCLSGYIDDGWVSDSFIQYENNAIAFDRYYTPASYTRLVKLISKAQTIARITGQLRFKVVNKKGTLRLITDIHGSTI